ncbi:helicase associated domain-containing protein [Streptomyces sp. BHT-5-2]|uniref:helicase associated domain-containing protein n=1 Tax=Streptomyces sp. BHT-5-2 TaxID=2866715 RepID=UPI0037DA3F56
MPLLRFSLPRDPDVIAMFLRTRGAAPDSEVWLSGLNALRTWVEKHGDAQVPLDAVVPIGTTEADGEDNAGNGNGDTYALGAWVSEQRRAFRAGTLKAWRVDLLNELGMVWSVADARFWKNLAAARDYFALHGTLAAPKDASIDTVAVGQWLANCRKTDGLGKDEERAEARRRALEAIDPDWNPTWPIDWQRRYAALTGLIKDGATLEEILPGVTVSSQHIGAWLQAQREGWERLSEEQRERLAGLGVGPAPSPAPAPKPEAVAAQQPTAVPAGVPGLAKMTAFERGIAALAQYTAREGHTKVPRKHEENLHPDDGDLVPVRLGVWLSNTKSRRAKLTNEQLTTLTELGLDWT